MHIEKPHPLSPGRRDFLRSSLQAAGTIAFAPTLGACSKAWLLGQVPAPEALRQMSRYGTWRMRRGLPEFIYTADQEALPEAEWDPIDSPKTRRHFHMLGNRSIQMQVANDGTVGIFDESEGERWLVYADATGGAGVSEITEPTGQQWGSAFAARPAGSTPERVFGPTYFQVVAEHEGLTLERTLLCPEGEAPWVLVRVRLTLAASASARSITHHEKWQLRPRFLTLWQKDNVRSKQAATVQYRIEQHERKLVAEEDFSGVEGAVGAEARLLLEALGATTATMTHTDENHPALAAQTDVHLTPGQSQTLWFRFGRDSDVAPQDPEAYFETSLQALRERLPKAETAYFPKAKYEIPWHVAALTGGASVDRILGGHTLNQAGAYSFIVGHNAAARDALQHAMPLVYSEPDLALSVLCNTCAWGSPDGDLPFALTHTKAPLIHFRPSDQNLWAFWLAAEYAFATGNLAAFDRVVPFHPSTKAEAVSLREHLVRMFRFFIDTVGRGSKNHVRILNADWNDKAIEMSGVSKERMIEEGGSVLNSAMASWVLSVFAPLMDKLGEQAIAAEAREHSESLRRVVAEAWNGQWFHRAYAPGGNPVGDDKCWLEVQPWALLCGAAKEADARGLLHYIDTHHRAESPLGARLFWPATTGMGTPGGGIWPAINMTLIWAASKYDPDLAWNEWRRMSLDAHTAAYPDIWEGTLSGPDSWNSPESDRPGRTWSSPLFSMQSFPVNNLHAHAQPVLSYLRLLGIEPTSRGTLAIGGGGTFISRTFSINQNGTGQLKAQGKVELETRLGLVLGDAGDVRF